MNEIQHSSGRRAVDVNSHRNTSHQRPMYRHEAHRIERHAVSVVLNSLIAVDKALLTAEASCEFAVGQMRFVLVTTEGPYLKVSHRDAAT